MLDKQKTELGSGIYFVAVLYMMVMSLNAVVANKLIESPVGVFSAASIVSPIWFMLGDIIADVYGYKISRILFWSVALCQIFFSLFCHFITKLPSPIFWHGQISYDFVTGNLFRIAVFALVGNLIAWRVNIFFLLKWKLLMKGKYFFLRSVGSSGIGEILFSLLSIFPVIVGTMPLKDVWSVILISCALKLIGLIMISPVANLCVNSLTALDKIGDCSNVNPLITI